MRVIDADELLKIYKKWLPQLSSKEDEGDRRGVETCIAVLEDMPTVDAVPVVRCRECIHKTDDENENGSPYCLQLEMYLNKELDFFCKYGERKGDVD